MSDLISRQDAINALVEKGQSSKRYKLGEFWELNLSEIEEALDDVPSVEPEQKFGKWVYKPDEYDDSTYECSQCGEPWTLIDGTPEENNMKFCPNCGADMRGENGKA